MMRHRLHLHPVARAGYVSAAVWAGLVAAYGSSVSTWWGPWQRWLTALPVIVLCLAAAAHSTGRSTQLAAIGIVAYAAAQTVRVQWSPYQWQAVLVASATYGLVAMLGLVLLVYVTIVTLMSAGRGAVSDDRSTK